MIKKINQIKQFGIYKSFNWTLSIPEFQKLNLIFGWNYSGKTTFSRIFRAIELNELPPNFDSGKFEVEFVDNYKINETSLESPFQIRVFNADYIRDNIKWEEGMSPILILGEDSIALQHKLDEENSDHTQLIREEREKQEQFEQQRAALENALSESASFIKNNLAIPGFDKRDLKALIGSFEGKILPQSDLEREKALKQKVFASEKKPLIQLLSFSSTELTKLLHQVNELESRAIIAKVIERLQEAPSLNNWVQRGLEMQKGKERCIFCEQTVTESFIENLNLHFSTDYSQLLADISNLVAKLESQKMNFPRPIPETSFYEGLKEKHLQCARDLANHSVLIVSAIEAAILCLGEKKDKPFQNDIRFEENVNLEKTAALIEDINRIIEENNRITDGFESEKNQAAEELEKYYAARFIEDKNYFNIRNKLAQQEECLRVIRINIKEKKDSVKELEKQISESVKGAEEINKILQLYFNKKEIAIQINHTGKFILTRDEQIANNLSEGERTAIAFSYFIASLNDKSTTKEDAIIFIDDPISSLDSNHLFNIYSIIKNELEDCKQLFISTHNFEFFNLLKDWIHGIKRIGPNKTNPVWACYLIDRQQNQAADQSVIVELPKLLQKFKSEYHYLFSIILDFHKAPTTDFDKLFSLPNHIRRFIEAFLGFKIPKYAGFKSKLPSFIPEAIERDRVQKFIDQYSHNNSLPRSLNFPALGECKEVVRIVMEATENLDQEHYRILCEECSDEPE